MNCWSILLKAKVVRLKYYFTRAAILLILTNSICFANFTSRYSSWVGFDIGGPFRQSSPWHYDLMNQARFPTNPTRMEQYFIRSSAYYQLDNWSFWLGGDLIYVNLKNEPTTLEQRLWPQVEYDKQLSKHVVISLRTRLENRWLGRQAGTAIRFRQRIELSFNHWNQHNIDIDIFDEVFLGLKRPSWVTNRRLDQNRVFFVFLIPICKYFAIDTGYLNIFRPRTPQNRIEHIMVLALAVNFDGRSTFPIRAI